MLKKVDKIRDLASDIENYLADSKEVMNSVETLLEYALGLVGYIDDEEKERIEKYLEDAIDKISDLNNQL